MMNNNLLESVISETIFKDNLSAKIIIRRKLLKMSKYPSETLRNELSEIGIECDYQSSDAGNDPAQIKE